MDKKLTEMARPNHQKINKQSNQTVNVFAYFIQ